MKLEEPYKLLKEYITLNIQRCSIKLPSNINFEASNPNTSHLIKI